MSVTKEMKPIPGFPDYLITKDGKVWSLPRERSSVNGKWLIRYKDRKGYLYVDLYRNKTKTRRYIHKLVLETYISPCPTGLECRHLDGNPLNNNSDNLKWGTHIENMQDMARHGTRNTNAAKGEKNSHAKLKEAQVIGIIQLYNTKLFTQEELARLAGVKHAAISKIVTGRTWKHLQL